jgi:hypothetical protein
MSEWAGLMRLIMGTSDSDDFYRHATGTLP